jgi:hypothetical protein
MSSKSTARLGVLPVPLDFLGNAAAGRDLKYYLQAIYSYPDRLANAPYLSFQRHLQNVIFADQRRSTSRKFSDSRL